MCVNDKLTESNLKSGCLEMCWLFDFFFLTLLCVVHLFQMSASVRVFQISHLPINLKEKT